MTTVRAGESKTLLLIKDTTIDVIPSGSCIVERYTNPASIIEKDTSSSRIKKGPYPIDYGFKVTALSDDAEIIVDQYSFDFQDSLFRKSDLVVGIGGQSNADGVGVLPSTADGENSSVVLYTKNSEYELCSEPAGRTGPNWINNIPDGNPVTPGDSYSFTTSLGKSLLNITGMKPLMVPCAIGSTAMENWAEPATEDDMETLFGAFTARVKEAKLNAKDVPPLIVWFGHEANADDISENLATGVYGYEYVNKWHNLIEDLRERFPTSPVIYAQLATHYTASLATDLRQAAESQRIMESTYGDTGTNFVKWVDAGLTIDFSENFITENTDANNVITVSNGKMQMVSDGSGSPSVSGGIAVLTPGKYYKINITATGTGTWRFFSDLTQVGASNRSTGTVDIEFLAGTDLTGTYPDKGRARITRTASATVNLEFTINSIEEAIYPAIDNTYMIVTHDLPRNVNDGYHITTAGLKEVGLRYAKCYAERVLGMHWINGTGPRLVSVTLPTTSTVLVTFNKEIQANANDYGVNLAASLFRVYDDGVEATLSSVARDTNTSAILITLSGATSGVVVVTYGDRAGPNDGGYRVGVVYDNDNMPAPQFGPIVAVAP